MLWNIIIILVTTFNCDISIRNRSWAIENLLNTHLNEFEMKSNGIKTKPKPYWTIDVVCCMLSCIALKPRDAQNVLINVERKFIVPFDARHMFSTNKF